MQSPPCHKISQHIVPKNTLQLEDPQLNFSTQFEREQAIQKITEFIPKFPSEEPTIVPKKVTARMKSKAVEQKDLMQQEEETMTPLELQNKETNTV